MVGGSGEAPSPLGYPQGAPHSRTSPSLAVGSGHVTQAEEEGFPHHPDHERYFGNEGGGGATGGDGSHSPPPPGDEQVGCHHLCAGLGPAQPCPGQQRGCARGHTGSSRGKCHQRGQEATKLAGLHLPGVTGSVGTVTTSSSPPPHHHHHPSTAPCLAELQMMVEHHLCKQAQGEEEEEAAAAGQERGPGHCHHSDTEHSHSPGGTCPLATHEGGPGPGEREYLSFPTPGTCTHLELGGIWGYWDGLWGAVEGGGGPELTPCPTASAGTHGDERQSLAEEGTHIAPKEASGKGAASSQ